MYINNNLAALNAWQNLLTAQGSISDAVSKLSSGYQINTAADGPAAFAIIQQMQGQVNGLNQATNNAQDGISMVQTALGATNQLENILQNMRSLAVQASNGTQTSAELTDIQGQMTQFSAEISQIAATTQFNTLKLLNGSQASGVTLQVGANATESIQFSISNSSSSAILTSDSTSISISGTMTSTVDVTSLSAASAAIVSIDSAISNVASTAANLGSVQDRLQFVQANLASTAENLTAAQARIQDVDQAKEMTKFSSAQALLQYGTNVLWQANQIPQGLMTLLR